MNTYKDFDGARFHYNSDFSGDVKITDRHGEKVAIPGKSILRFVEFCWNAPRKIEAIENASFVDLVGDKK